MESVFVRYLRTRLIFFFTKRTSGALRASEFCENKLVRKYRTSGLSMKKSTYSLVLVSLTVNNLLI